MRAGSDCKASAIFCDRSLGSMTRLPRSPQAVKAVGIITELPMGMAIAVLYWSAECTPMAGKDAPAPTGKPSQVHTFHKL